MILFIISLFFMIISSVLIIRNIKKCEPQDKIFHFPPLTKENLFVISGILIPLISAIANEFYRNAYIFMMLAVLSEYLLLCFSGGKKLVEFLSKTILVTAILEMTLFNFPAFYTWSGNYNQSSLDLSKCEVEAGNADISENNINIKGKEEVVLTFKNLDTEIRTIHVNIKFNGQTNHKKTVIDISDETTSSYRYDIAQTDIVKKRSTSGYIPCDFSGKVGNFRIKFTGYNDNDNITIKSVVFNEPIPFEVSYFRTLFIIIVSAIVYSICHLEAFQQTFEERKRLCRNLIITTTCFLCIISVIIVYLNLGSTTVSDHFHLKTGNQITQEIVDAFEAGQVNLLSDPSEEILALENPYDRLSREKQGVYVPWDHVLYNGKYYSYYGVAPVLLLYLPYHLITGYYCSTNFSILLFSIIGIVFLSMTYFIFIKKFFGKIPAGMVFAGHIILMMSCGIWYSISRNIFYEISISSGFMFTVLGAYFLLSSNAVGEGKISCFKTCLSSVFFSLAVLCRPTLAVYCICACVYFAYGFFKIQNPAAAPEPVKKAAFLMCALTPFIIIGGFQMWYNYARFGSPLDFGIQYSLTINDFTKAEYHTVFVFISLFNYLFAVPKFSPEYPFISTNITKLKANGFFFNDDGCIAGIFFLALPVFAYFLSKKAFDKLPDKKAKIKAVLTIGLPCVIMPLAIIFSIWESGYAVRYVADFSWQIIFGAYAIIFSLYLKTKDNTKKIMTRNFMAFSSVWAIIVNGVQIFIFTFDSYLCAVFLKTYYPEICWSFEHIINFWK